MAKKKDNDKRIMTIGKLKQLAGRISGLDCFILLNGGLKSSKHIRYISEHKKFLVWNLIDDSEQELTENQLFDGSLTNIGEAMKKGGLIID